MAEPVFYTLSEAAQVLGVHYETVARWVRRGKLPGVKLSRRKVVVPKEKLDALLSGESLASADENTAPIGSPQRWRALFGTLTPEEAEYLRACAEVFETVEEVG